MDKQTNRKSRCDTGQILLTDRDVRVLRWIAEQYAARFEQVQYLLSQDARRGAKRESLISESAARQVIARWRRAGWVTRSKILAADPPWMWTSARFIQQLSLPYRAYEPSLARLEHIWAVNNVRLSLEEAWPDYQWISERAIRADLSYGKGLPLPHVPDGKFLTTMGTVIVEVELSLKSPLKLWAILEELVSTYETVWYFVTDETRPAVVAARKRLDPVQAQQIHVYTYSPEQGTDTSEAWAR